MGSGTGNKTAVAGLCAPGERGDHGATTTKLSPTMCTSLELPTSPASLGPALQPRLGVHTAEGDGIAQLHCPVTSETTFPQASGLRPQASGSSDSAAQGWATAQAAFLTAPG